MPGQRQGGHSQATQPHMPRMMSTTIFTDKQCQHDRSQHKQMMWGKKVKNHRNQVWRTMTHTPLQDEYQVDLSRSSQPRWGKPVLANIPSRLFARGPNPTRTEHNDPLQGKMPVVRTWSDKTIFILNYIIWFYTP